jgi:hypothetical protein
VNTIRVANALPLPILTASAFRGVEVHPAGTRTVNRPFGSLYVPCAHPATVKPIDNQIAVRTRAS